MNAIAKSTCLQTHSDAGDIPVTEDLVSFIRMIQHARDFYVAEFELNSLANRPKELVCSMSRCKSLFSDYSVHAEKLGLKANEITIRTIFYADVPLDEDLPKHWVFNPWKGWFKINN